MDLNLIIISALILDLLIGDPQGFPHPVRWIGRFARYLEKVCRDNFLRETFLREKNLRGKSQTQSISRPFISGALTALIVYSFSYFIPWFLIRWLGSIHPHLADIFSILVIYTTIALRSLVDHSSSVLHSLIQLKIKRARKNVGMIVGRDTDQLSRREIIRACIESVAESMVDGVTAPLFFAIFLGAPGAMLYRSINTLDSIFGHRDENYEYFGKVSARVDDLANFLPARLTSPLVSIAAAILGYHPLHSIGILIRDGGKHSSPNSGLSEAAIAGALGIELGGMNYYDGEESFKSYLGEPRESLRTSHILKANHLVILTSVLSCAFFLWIHRLWTHP